MGNNGHVLQQALESFTLTICLESVVLVWLFKEFRHVQAVLICCLVNMVTHPVYFTARHHFFPHEYWVIGVAVLEPVVVVIEAWVYRVMIPLPRSKAIFAAVLANAGSLLVGVLSRVIWGTMQGG